LGARILRWVIRGAPELGLAFFYSTDITEQRLAEDANRQLSSIVRQTEDAVVVTNCEGVIEYVNPAFERLTGYTKEEALGKTPRVIKSGVHEAEFYRNLWDTILKGEVFQSEMANLKKNGELFYEVKTITPLRDAQGNITHFVATGKDITRHKHDEVQLRNAYDELELRVQQRTEELTVANADLLAEINERKKVQIALEQSQKELSASEERSRHLIQYAPAAIYEMDFFGQRFLSVNDVACQWTGYTKEELLCMSPLDLTDMGSKVTFRERVKAKLNGEDIDKAVEYKIIAKDGHEILAEMHVGAFTYKDGKPESVLVVAHDITQRKRAEESLQAANEELSRFNNIMVGRELRMIELKNEVNELCTSISQPPRYALDFEKQ
jgi:PAS domain S-box-containing protein